MHQYFVTNLAKEYVEDREDRLDDFRQEVVMKLVLTGKLNLHQ